MAFDKTHQPCPDCNGSDCLSYNKDGSTWCFSCETYTRSDKVKVVEEDVPVVSEKDKTKFIEKL